MEKDTVLLKNKEAKEAGQDVITEIGLFAVVVNKAGDPLLKRQTSENEWKIIGGNFKTIYFALEIFPEHLSEYQQAIFAYLANKLIVEAGLILLRPPQPLMLVPAWSWEVTEKDQLHVNLSFSTPIFLNEKYIQKTEGFGERFKRAELMFMRRKCLCSPNISQKTRFLAEETLKAFSVNRAFVL